MARTDKTFRKLADSVFVKYKQSNLLFDTTDNKTISYPEGFELMKLVSEKLLIQGINKGDKVLTFTPLSIESVVLCWACFYNGIVFVPVDHNWSREMLMHIVAEIAPKLVLTDAERFAYLAGNCSDGTILLTGNDKVSEKIPLFFEWLQKNDFKADQHMVDVYQSDLAVILYTSGSTGAPKGVMLSQQALFNSGYLTASHFTWDHDDIFMNLGDLHSMSGLRNTCFAPLHVGASFIIASDEERKNILSLFVLINRLKIRYIGVAPTIIRQMNILFSESRKKKITSLKAILCTGGLLAQDQLEAFYRTYSIPVLNYYGLTETAGICSGHNFETFNPKDNSIGHAIGADLIINRDSKLKKNESIGELLVKSDNLMSGYFNREKETARVLKNGYFHTGDIVRKRDDGCIELIGRKRNIVKNIHSELIYLEEIDLSLESHPLVQEACTCSYAYFEEDEKIVAFIVLRNNTNSDIQGAANSIKKHLIEKIGKNRMPWCYYFEENLPRNSSGKIQRQLLKEKLYAYIQSHRKRYF